MDDLLAGFDDDDDYAFLNDMPVPGGALPSVPSGGGAAASGGEAGNDEENKDEETKEEDPNAHKLEYDSVTMTRNEQGKKVLNNFLTFENEIGRGNFCTVIKANGYYEASDETVPYAIKVFRSATLNGMVQSP